jgi:transketolase
VLDGFHAKFPRQYINAGVAEQNMTLLATGLALEGRIVFTYSIANFPTLRCLEMIRNDAAYHDLPVKVVAIGGGFSYGSLGISHHATEDLAIMRALPNVDVCVPGSLHEVEEATRALASRPGSGYLRLDKDPGFQDALSDYSLGAPRLIGMGKDVAMLVSGGITSEAMAARSLLAEEGVGAAVYSVHSLRPINSEAIAQIASHYPVIATVEEHSVVGGLGAAVLEVLADLSVWPRRFVRIGLTAGFSSAVGSQGYLRRVYGLDAAAIAARVQAVVGQTASVHEEIS